MGRDENGNQIWNGMIGELMNGVGGSTMIWKVDIVDVVAAIDYFLHDNAGQCHGSMAKVK